MRKSTKGKLERVGKIDLLKGEPFIDPVVIAAMCRQGYVDPPEAIRMYVACGVIWHARLGKPYYESIRTIADLLGVSRGAARQVLRRTPNLRRERKDGRWAWKLSKLGKKTRQFLGEDSSPVPSMEDEEGGYAHVPTGGYAHVPIEGESPGYAHVPQLKNTPHLDGREGDGSGFVPGAKTASCQIPRREPDFDDGLPPSKEDLLKEFLLSCQEAHPDVHVHGFMGAKGGKPLDLDVAGELCSDYPLMTAAAWRRSVSRWLAATPGGSDRLVIRAFKKWFRRTPGGRHPRRPSLGQDMRRLEAEWRDGKDGQG